MAAVCKWIEDGNGVRCVNCGTKRDKARARICGASPAIDTSEPGKIRMAWNYSVAVAEWIAAGSPTRSPERIAEIHSVCAGTDITPACPHYSNAGRPHCRICGCSLSMAPNGLVSMIAMATKKCPDTPPRWGDDGEAETGQ